MKINYYKKSEYYDFNDLDESMFLHQQPRTFLNIFLASSGLWFHVFLSYSNWRQARFCDAEYSNKLVHYVNLLFLL